MKWHKRYATNPLTVMLVFLIALDVIVIVGVSILFVLANL
jgi:hypothetical protein